MRNFYILVLALLPLFSFTAYSQDDDAPASESEPAPEPDDNPPEVKTPNADSNAEPIDDGGATEFSE